MTRYLATYHYSDGRDDMGGAGTLGLYDSISQAVRRAVYDFSGAAPVYVDPCDVDAWYRVDVCTYDGCETDPDSAHDDVIDTYGCDDGDVLHASACAGVVCLEICGARLDVSGSIAEVSDGR